MVRSTDITSVTEHRQNLREHLDRVKRTGRPLFITTNGEAEAVVLSPAAFDELTERAEFAQTVEMIREGIADIEAGRVHDAREAMHEIAREFGLKLNR